MSAHNLEAGTAFGASPTVEVKRTLKPYSVLLSARRQVYDKNHICRYNELESALSHAYQQLTAQLIAVELECQGQHLFVLRFSAFADQIPAANSHSSMHRTGYLVRCCLAY